MSCHHPKSNITTPTDQLTDDTRQVKRVCRRCGTLLTTTIEEVPQWSA